MDFEFRFSLASRSVPGMVFHQVIQAKIRTASEQDHLCDNAGSFAASVFLCYILIF